MVRQKTLITGASSGIGATYADRLARQGHDLVLVARDVTRLAALAERLTTEMGVVVNVIAADLTQKDDLLKVEAALLNDADLTAFVNNAGIAGGGPILTANPDELESIISLNVVALTRLATAAAKNFGDKNAGTIINIASVTALFADQLDPVYPATKAYVIAFSQSLAIQLKPSNVRVQVVLPGATRTEIWKRSGGSIDALPPEIVMEVGELVDASLAGLEMGEVVTIPSLPDDNDWNEYEAARMKMVPNLSRNHAAKRYGVESALLDA
jgi:uncharacterized protein